MNPDVRSANGVVAGEYGTSGSTPDGVAVDGAGVDVGVVAEVVAPPVHAASATTTSGSRIRVRIGTRASLVPRRDTAAVEAMAFLRQHHPFSELSSEDLERIRRSLEIVHIPAGEAVLHESGEPADAVGVIRKGELELITGDVVVDLLEPGELFGLTSVMSDLPPSMTVRAVEDTLCYLVPADVARAVLSTPAAGPSVWAIARQRVRAADAVTLAMRGADPRVARIGTLVRRQPVTIAGSASVADAAARMRDERVSSLLVESREGLAIVTDRDLRARVVAERGSFDRPVIEIATRPIHVVTADLLAGEAMLQMLEFGVHHLPVVEAGVVVGVLTDTDLMDVDRGSPFAIRSAIARARTDTEVAFAARGLPVVATSVVEAGIDPIDASRVITLIGDAARRRLLSLAVQELGEPPCPYAWLALGSAARYEGSMHSDQDHALALGPGFVPEEHDPYFAALAERVTAGLEEAGFPRCRADVMAVHPAMRRSIDDWAAAFRDWIAEHGVDASILSSITFDFRVVDGSLDAEGPLDAAVADARQNPAFLRLLARVALRDEPPTGFLRHLVVEAKGDHAGQLDLKHGGIVIVTNIARARGIAAGTSRKDTLGRLRAAVDAGTLGGSSGEELAEAFRFLLDLRLRHQVTQVRAGAAADDFVAPPDLGGIERAGLREAFRSIRAAQQLLALDLDLR
jgi:CBS domain-containing protein